FSAWTALSSPHVARLRFGSFALPVEKIASESGSAVFLEVALSFLRVHFFMFLPKQQKGQMKFIHLTFLLLWQEIYCRMKKINSPIFLWLTSVKKR
ncbi:MAG: hypothetical protein FWF85_10500, partial [Clostridiales bacterium]|nr:hypothetical protein [Clostridiales bacterium]